MNININPKEKTFSIDANVTADELLKIIDEYKLHDFTMIKTIKVIEIAPIINPPQSPYNPFPFNPSVPPYPMFPYYSIY